MTKKHRSSEQGVALIIVLSLVAVMAMLAMVFFSSTAAESQSSQSQSSAQSAQQLASSAAQIVMAQIQLAGNQTAPGNSTAVAWTSQPGLLRTFTPSGPSTVYKLYSDTDMVTGNFSETNFAPPSTWKSSPAIYCDLNAPVARVGNSTSLAYPIADPSVAGVVPGFTLGTAPGYSGSNPSPTNNPLPMPVRWLYVLKNGQLTTPSSVDAGGNVTFTSSDPQPSAANPVVGRIAFWADDETCKVNINTAGYAKNDSSYWTYWDSPFQLTKNEMYQLSVAQPWRNEFLRYPGHPATTGLNLAFGDLNLSAAQIASLTPRYSTGGSGGGFTLTYNTTGPSLPLKTDRLYATVDELFYGTNYGAYPRGGANTANISSATLQQRRFLLTANSRAPETTLFDTPRVTIWPEDQNSSNRTPLDQLIAFCSTIGSGTSAQPFYFVRTSGNATTDFTILSNVSLHQYLQKLTGRTIPGIGGNFQSKYAAQPIKCDQIITSFLDAIRLSNLYDATSSTKYTAAFPGYVAPSPGPNETFAAGRVPTVHEVNVIFSSTNSTGGNGTVSANCMLAYWLYWPTAGPVSPGRNMRMEVSGLESFKVNGEPIFSSGNWSQTDIDTDINRSQKRLWGGVDANITLYGNQTFTMPPANTINATHFTSNTTFKFTGGNLTIKLYSPATAAKEYQECTLNFPDAPAVPVPAIGNSTWTLGGRFQSTYPGSGMPAGLFKVLPQETIPQERILSVNSRTADYRSLVLKNTLTTNDFAPNPDYGTQNYACLYSDYVTDSGLSARFGKLYSGAPSYDKHGQPLIPKNVVIENDYPPGDWDNGLGILPDGSYSPKADEGEEVSSGSGWNYSYFYIGNVKAASQGVFSPNRQIPSAAIFGNIPTGTWRTLLFRPAKTWHMGGASHFGATNPPDMFLLDFFHMPVVEPYAISEPFSTAGKINMNAQVVPFSGYLTRDTALRAVLASTRLTAIPKITAGSGSIKSQSQATLVTKADPITAQTRYPLNIDQTLLGFKDRYSGADGAGRRVFLTAAEICGLDLVPDSIASSASLSTFWAANPSTGDNSRERPYAHLLPRLTTKSNSYSVHVTAQALAPGAGATGWQEGKGKVLSEWRGAYTIERYVDPNDARFTAGGAPNFLSGTQPVGPYYKFRVLGTRRFNP
jgi:type II secretory pathway pseudopilin PulG